MLQTTQPRDAPYVDHEIVSDISQSAETEDVEIH